MKIKDDVLVVLSELEYPSPNHVRIAGQLYRGIRATLSKKVIR